jgi:hypothetical protein
MQRAVVIFLGPPHQLPAAATKANLEEEEE